MKGEDIKQLYQVSSEAHKSIEHTLRQLGDASSEHYKRRRKVQRLMVALAVIALSIVLSTAAYATKLFGLLAEPVGKYGLDLQIVQATADSAQTQVAPTEKKYAMPKPNYLPKGCCQLIGEDEDLHELLNSEGVTSYNSNGNYKYTDGNNVWVLFHVYQAEEYHEEARYIVDSFEREYNGHKTVFLTRQFEDNGEQEHYAVKYFEDWGFVVDCYFHDMTELMKIMEGLELQEPEEEAADYLELPTVDISDDPYAGYAVSMTEEERVYQLGETFSWSHQIVDAPSPIYSFKDGEYEITVTSVKEHDGVKGLDKSKLLAPNDEEWFARYFNSDGSLKTPYIRTDTDHGDGVDSLGHSESKEVSRRFYLVTIEVKAIEESYGGFNGQFMTSAGGAIYRDKCDENGTDIFTIGVAADQDETDGLALLIPSKETVIDEKTETVAFKEIRTVVPLMVDQ